MSILDSQIAPFVIILAIFAVLAGFFRKLLLKVIIVLAIQIVLLALFPSLLQKFVNFILAVRNAL